MGGIGRRSRRQALRAAGLTAKAGERNALGMLKMSDILLQVAQPLLRDLEMPEQEELFRHALSLGALIWNASRPPTPEARERDLDEVLHIGGERVAPEVEELMRETFRRARLLHPDDPRLITETEVHVHEDGQLHLSVITLISRPSGS